MSSIQILLVEDEESLASFVKTELQFEGYKVFTCKNGEEAIEAFNQNPTSWSIILLDWMLPKLNGLEVCRRIRRTSHIPIIMMTARDYIGDKVAGLDGGADDYITKPFEIEELLARIRVILRREKVNAERIKPLLYQLDDLTLDVEKRVVYRGDKEYFLPQREFDLLLYLIKNQGKVMSREEILNTVWGFEYVGQTNIVDVYVRYLRSKIDTPPNKKIIQTVRGIGYCLRLEHE